MAEIILFVFEGGKTEVKIYEKLYQQYFSYCNNINIISTYNTNIYKLWAEISQDEYLDIVELVREKNSQNEINLKDVNRDQIAQVYLFFDHDAHDPDASIEIVHSMLELYSEETENGKLFISYPMVESLKDISKKTEFKDQIAKISENHTYKKVVNKRTIYKDFRKITKSDWDFVISQHLKKGNYIVNDEYSLIDYKNFNKISQLNIFQAQRTKYIQTYNSVSVLNGFPFFLVEYFGSDYHTTFQKV